MNKVDVEQAYQALKQTGVDEDDLHEAVVSLLPRLDCVRDVRAYLRKSAFNYRIRRKQRLNYQMQLDHLELLAGKSTSNDLHTSSDSSILTNLTRRERLAIELSCIENKSRTEVAETLDCSESAVGGLLYRARKRINDSMKEC